MLDNWTAEEFFKVLYFEGSYTGMAESFGRIAIVDDPHLEKVWDTFVQAWTELERIYDSRLANK